MAMPNLHLDNPDVLHAWERGLLWLSLERGLPLWKDLGLTFRSPERVQEAVRTAAWTQQALWDAPVDDPQYPANVAVVLEGLLEHIGSVEGRAAATALRDWVEHQVAPSARRPPWEGAWRALLPRLSLPRETLALPRAGLAPAQAARLIDLARAWSQARDRLDAAVAAAERQTLQGWDREQYERYRRDDPDVSPLDGLAQFLKGRAFADFWRQVIQGLTPEELAVLVRWGQAHAPAAGFDPAAVAVPAKAPAG
jgi:hypothetical protein